MSSYTKIYYAVRRGWFRGVFLHKKIAHLAVRSFPGAKMQEFFSRSNADKYVYARRIDEPVRLVVYTDGSYRHRYNNAGYGVFFGADDNRNTGGTLRGSYLSSQRAETYAAIVALLMTKDDVEIRTDSLELVYGATVRPTCVHNPDHSLYIAIKLLSKNRRVLWTYVKSHAGYYGNEKADTLARQGSMVRISSHTRLKGMTYKDVLCLSFDYMRQP